MKIRRSDDAEHTVRTRTAGVVSTPRSHSSRLALTATVTSLVQEDIVAKLALRSPRRFIGGFRRTNIAIAAVEVPKAERIVLVDGLSTRTKI